MTGTHDVIRRTAELDLDRDALWELVATPEGWASWLVDEVAIAPDAELGTEGLLRDGDIVRRVRLDAVGSGPGRVEFTWWEIGDEASMSSVQLEVRELEPGRSQLVITERPSTDGDGLGSEARAAWEVRVYTLWACTVAAALV